MLNLQKKGWELNFQVETLIFIKKQAYRKTPKPASVQ